MTILLELAVEEMKSVTMALTQTHNKRPRVRTKHRENTVCSGIVS